jgi:hypothetical protein
MLTSTKRTTGGVGGGDAGTGDGAGVVFLIALATERWDARERFRSAAGTSATGVAAGLSRGFDSSNGAATVQPFLSRTTA